MVLLPLLLLLVMMLRQTEETSEEEGDAGDPQRDRLEEAGGLGPREAMVFSHGE